MKNWKEIYQLGNSRYFLSIWLIKIVIIYPRTMSSVIPFYLGVKEGDINYKKMLCISRL